MRQGRNREEEEMFKSCICQFIYPSPYLSDDLSIFSVDLSDASPLSQEGEDLIELKEEDAETVKLQWRCFIFKSPAGCLHKSQTLLFILGVALKPQFKIRPRDYMMSTTTHCN